ncbi:hypothetical protein [Cryobacterium sp. M91]|uniref:hypothetical protein n=1 Tax=Cryobacterium sp. M91 TaxID=2048294 RepID=UPI000CE30250|nr:hypothetical protein [Cryobacterium sp. M91]
MSLEQRLSVPDVDPEAYKPMFALEKYIHAGSLGEALMAQPGWTVDESAGADRPLRLRCQLSERAAVLLVTMMKENVYVV